MKVSLAFLPNVRPSKILACFVLNLPSFSFFIHSNYVSFYSIYVLFAFLLKHFDILKGSVLPVLTLKAKFLCGTKMFMVCYF